MYICVCCECECDVSVCLYNFIDLYHTHTHTHTHAHIYICVYLGSISSLMQISLNIIDILCLYIFFWILVRIPVLLLSDSGGIDLGIVHSCMYPKYFLPDCGPSSGEDLLQKWCNFCFCKLLLCKDVFAVEDYRVCFKCNSVNSGQ